MKKCYLLIFFTPLIGSLWLINSAWAKTDSAQIGSEKIHGAEIRDVYSKLISLQNSDLKLVIVLNATGGLQGIKMKTQDAELRLSPDGQIIKQSSNGNSLPILYTDTSYQHIRQIGDIPILYTDTSYQHIRQIGNIPILYANTLYQHVRQVGNIIIQYRNTSYQEIIQVIGNQPGVKVRIEKYSHPFL